MGSGHVGCVVVVVQVLSWFRCGSWFPTREALQAVALWLVCCIWLCDKNNTA